MRPELLALGAGAALVVRVAEPVRRPEVRRHVVPALAVGFPVALQDQLAFWAVAASEQLYAVAALGPRSEVLEALALGMAGSCVIREVLACRARPRRLLFVAAAGGLVVIRGP